MKKTLFYIFLGSFLLLFHVVSISFSLSFVSQILQRFATESIAFAVCILVGLEVLKHIMFTCFGNGALLGEYNYAQNVLSFLMVCILFGASYFFATNGAMHQAQTNLKTTEIIVNKAQQETQIKAEYKTMIEAEKAKIKALDSLKSSRFSWVGLDSLEKISYAHTLTRIQAYEQERAQALTRLHTQADTHTQENKTLTASISEFQFWFSAIIELLIILFTFMFAYFYKLPEIVNRFGQNNEQSEVNSTKSEQSESSPNLTNIKNEGILIEKQQINNFNANFCGSYKSELYTEPTPQSEPAKLNEPDYYPIIRKIINDNPMLPNKAKWDLIEKEGVLDARNKFFEVKRNDKCKFEMQVK